MITVNVRLDFKTEIRKRFSMDTIGRSNQICLILSEIIKAMEKQLEKSWKFIYKIDWKIMKWNSEKFKSLLYYTGTKRKPMEI